MSETILPPDSSDLKVEWLELDSRVYTGPKDGYTEIIHLDEESEPAAGSVRAVGYWHEEGHWGFVFEGGHICLVNNNRIRFVKGYIISVVQREAERNDVMAMEQRLSETGEESTHTETVAPKRRGRPPKVAQ